MTARITLTQTPVQITDGTDSAHVTVAAGFVEYADSADSAAWHRAARVINIQAPWIVWMRVASGSEGAVIVSKGTE